MDARLTILALAFACTQALAFEHRDRFRDARYAAVLSDDPSQSKLIPEGKAALRFLDYDWTLNDSRSSSPR